MNLALLLESMSSNDRLGKVIAFQVGTTMGLSCVRFLALWYVRRQDDIDVTSL